MNLQNVQIIVRWADTKQYHWFYKYACYYLCPLHCVCKCQSNNHASFYWPRKVKQIKINSVTMCHVASYAIFVIWCVVLTLYDVVIILILLENGPWLTMARYHSKFYRTRVGAPRSQRGNDLDLGVCRNQMTKRKWITGNKSHFMTDLIVFILWKW